MIKVTRLNSINELCDMSENVIPDNKALNVSEFGLFPDREFLLVIRRPNGSIISLPYFFSPLTDAQQTLVQAVPDSLKYIRNEKDLLQVLKEFIDPNADPATHYSFTHTHDDLLDNTQSFGYWIHRNLRTMTRYVRKDARPNVLVYNAGGWPELQFFRIG